MQMIPKIEPSLMQRFLFKIAVLFFLITAVALVFFHYLLNWLTKTGITNFDIHLVESLFLLIFTTLFTYILARYLLTSQKLLTSLFFANAAPIITSESNLLEKLITTADEGIVLSDADNIISSVNRAFTQIMGYTPEEIIGKPGSFLRSGRHSDSFYNNLWETMKTRGIWQGEMWVRRKNGEVFPEWLTYTTIKDAKGDTTNYLAIFSEITERKTSAERVQYLERNDPLTNLPNYAKVIEDLEVLCKSARRDNNKVAIIYINLDSLKKINEENGFVTGDKLLQAIANKLKLHAIADETVARLGGDEFMIAAPAQTNEEIIHLVTRTMGVIRENIVIEGKKFAITSSTGISVYPTDGDNVDMLIKDAKTAMQKSKEKGRDNFQFFTQDMNTAAAEYEKIEIQLRRALEQKEFQLYYQPLINLSNNEICGAEALIRWQSYGVGFIPPQKFIPIAEESGLIIPITDWVIKTACETNLEWKAAGIKIPVSVNISMIDIRQKNFKERVTEILNETGLNPNNLKLEITESVMMQDTEETISSMLKLKEMGVGIAVDDFGTGYSSLSYLKRLPIDYIKIDQAFVHDLVKDPDYKEIVRAIINVARSLKLTVIAEGVETKAQLDFLREHQCDMIQGYYFSKPVPADEFLKMLKEKKKLQD